MSELTLEQLEELERLEREATRVRWYPVGPDAHDGRLAADLEHLSENTWTVSSRRNRSGWCHDSGCEGYGIQERDARLIAATRNALPALLAAARELAELKSALDYLCRERDALVTVAEGDGDSSCACTEAASLVSLAQSLGWTPPGEQKGEEVGSDG